MICRSDAVRIPADSPLASQSLASGPSTETAAVPDGSPSITVKPTTTAAPAAAATTTSKSAGSGMGVRGDPALVAAVAGLVLVRGW